MKILWTSIGGALLSLCIALPANASSLLTFYNDPDAASPIERFTLECSLGCEAYDAPGDGGVFAGGTWGAVGDLFVLSSSNSNVNEERLAVNIMTGENFALGSGIKDESANPSFTSSAEYIMLKTGQAPNYGLIRSLFAGNEFTFTQIATGTGLSHFTEFGTVSAVPVPAAVWLFGTALIGFIGFSRRTKV